jgi:hypothetical protein
MKYYFENECVVESNFKKNEINEALKIIFQHKEELITAWKIYFNN